ncbi:hemopexin repeat-containing protein [Pontibacter kalidii]|uniref:hemopexin repeat-containing protein n=1 Tax=Pontibacter kalidii TaxID=2592049 RepID=UPI002252AFDE|nr:hemopexin repeat-containing protein [Pontibacter kalidii]
MFVFQAFGQQGAAGRKNGMLILGSADKKTLVERVDIGYRLYKSAVPFDYIIVSGGCAAHQSAICEATEMTSLLVEKGVPAEIIFKEEKSKNTVQNYVYSRMLRKADGSSVISPGDKLYVVSNHWHAIPVAARFTENDSVTAVYHIEGGILPKNTDKVNYTNIFDPTVGSDAFGAKALWPLVGASFSVENKKKGPITSYRLMGEVVSVQGAAEPGEGKVQRVAQALPAIPANWAGAVDAAYHNSIDNKVYIFRGGEYARFSPEAKALDAGYPKPLSDLVKNLPANWQSGFLDAAFFHPKSREIFLFKGEEYLQLSARNHSIAAGFPKKINTFVPDWPFAWGSGDLDAADYNSKENKIYLFRGKEYVIISGDKAPKLEPGYPKKIELAWPEAILGKQ